MTGGGPGGTRRKIGLSGSRSTSIPLYNILWAEVDNQTIIIRHAKKSVGASLSPETLTYPFELPSRSQVDRWIDLLLQAAYESGFPLHRKVEVGCRTGG